MGHVCRAAGRFLLYQNHTICTVLKVPRASKVHSLSLELIRDELQSSVASCCCGESALVKKCLSPCMRVTLVLHLLTDMFSAISLLAINKGTNAT